MPITAGTWKPIDSIGLNQNIEDTSTTQNHSLLRLVKCRDTGSTNYGDAEFIYLKGVASTVEGDAVVYDSAGVTARAAARAEGPVAVAMSACVASNFGWYQVRGLAKVKCATVAADTQAYLTATAGTIDDAHVAGDGILGMRISSADDTGFCRVMIDHANAGDTDNA